MNDCMKTFNINSADVLRKSEFAQRIYTQCITTIEANKRLLDSKTISYLILFNKINLKRTRDISSHDYGSVDMNIVYRISTKLLDKSVLSELRKELIQFKELEAGDDNAINR